MVNYLIPYVDPKRNDGEEDPMFREFTYGDKGFRGLKLLESVNKDDYLFFHTSINWKRYITAFYKVVRVMPINEARANPLIMQKYQNPHLANKHSHVNEVIVFGHPIESFELVNSIEMNEELLGQLGITFDPYTNFTVFGSLTSKFRNWYTLNDEQVQLLMKLIFDKTQQKMSSPNLQLSSNEIPQLLERDIENLIANSPHLIGQNLFLKEQQYVFETTNKRLDLLLENKVTGELTIVEIKKDAIDLKALTQLGEYIEEYKKLEGNKTINGVLIGNGVLPYFEEQIIEKLRAKNWRLLNYGWLFSLQEPYESYLSGKTEESSGFKLLIAESSENNFQLLISNDTDQDFSKVHINISEFMSEDEEVFTYQDTHYIKNVSKHNSFKVMDMTPADLDFITEYKITGYTAKSVVCIKFENRKLRNVLDFIDPYSNKKSWLIPLIKSNTIPIEKIVRVIFKGQFETTPSSQNKYYMALIKGHPQIKGVMEDLYKLVETYYRGSKSESRDKWEIASELERNHHVQFQQSEGTEILLSYCVACQEFFNLSQEDIIKLFLKYAL
ncbi:endonuclease NucS domain-containing protein [uncultured Planococcus sp.]|uniref:endonuclease NucS domain-containing protein n=1 Tax=uncultured Planococcus sp. TaxID=337815 RepID=UPI00260FACB4|nr:endonuclease NucS domain-containing protein [uncultured Planococcus sp.]